MSTKDATPKTLLEVITHFSNERTAWEYMRDRRWPNQVTCPRCGSERVHLIESRMIWRCNGCRKQFSVKVGTVFEDSPIKLTKWLPAMWLIANAKNGISSYEIHRALGVTQKTAWFMLHRIRLAMQNGSIEKLGDDVELDETYIGGKARNMHKAEKARKIHGAGPKDKEIVFGMVERGGDVKVQHVQNATRKTLQAIVKDNVIEGCRIHTDAHPSYDGLGTAYQHYVIDHAVSYVEGIVHTNTMENFWSLLKRTLSGTYVSVEPFHLHRYLTEQAFRFNERKGTDKDRFMTVASQVSGRRLTYKQLTGKELAHEG